MFSVESDEDSLSHSDASSSGMEEEEENTPRQQRSPSPHSDGGGGGEGFGMAEDAPGYFHEKSKPVHSPSEYAFCKYVTMMLPGTSCSSKRKQGRHGDTRKHKHEDGGGVEEEEGRSKEGGTWLRWDTGVLENAARRLSDIRGRRGAIFGLVGGPRPPNTKQLVRTLSDQLTRLGADTCCRKFPDLQQLHDYGHFHAKLFALADSETSHPHSLGYLVPGALSGSGKSQWGLRNVLTGKTQALSGHVLELGNFGGAADRVKVITFALSNLSLGYLRGRFLRPVNRRRPSVFFYWRNGQQHSAPVLPELVAEILGESSAKHFQKRHPPPPPPSKAQHAPAASPGKDRDSKQLAASLQDQGGPHLGHDRSPQGFQAPQHHHEPVVLLGGGAPQRTTANYTPIQEYNNELNIDFISKVLEVFVDRAQIIGKVKDTLSKDLVEVLHTHLQRRPSQNENWDEVFVRHEKTLQPFKEFIQNVWSPFLRTYVHLYLTQDSTLADAKRHLEDTADAGRFIGLIASGSFGQLLGWLEGVRETWHRTAAAIIRRIVFEDKQHPTLPDNHPLQLKHKDPQNRDIMLDQDLAKLYRFENAGDLQKGLLGLFEHVRQRRNTFDTGSINYTILDAYLEDIFNALEINYAILCLATSQRKNPETVPPLLLDPEAHKVLLERTHEGVYCRDLRNFEHDPQEGKEIPIPRRIVRSMLQTMRIISKPPVHWTRDSPDFPPQHYIRSFPFASTSPHLE